MKRSALVTGAGGMIGGHLVRRLLDEDFDVRAVDFKPLDQWWQLHHGAENVGGRFGDLRVLDRCTDAVDGVDWVFNLAADMGGMAFIDAHKADCMLSVLISTNMLLAARTAGVKRFFYSSSACVYAADKQTDADVTPLREGDAYPAMPEDGYGWEKLFSERMAQAFRRDYGLETRIARYHNVYGAPLTWHGGREKAPAAICRKVAEVAAGMTDHINIWGDGLQARSFMAMDDCIEGTMRIMRSDCPEPLNLGSSELVTINELVDIVEDIAGVQAKRIYRPDQPQGVRGRNSDNTLLRAAMGWEPSISLYDGLAQLYPWVLEQVRTVKYERELFN